MNENEIITKAIETYGINDQLDMVVEECSELIKAVQKFKRKKFTIYAGKIPHGKSIEQMQVYHDLCSEAADVRIMLKQLDIILNKEEIDLIEERKLSRLKERLNK